MTREEAISFLKGYLDEEIYNIKCRNAHKMAIEALEHPEKNVIAVVPCGDTISRQAVLEQINCWIDGGEYGYTNATYYLIRRMQNLPLVTPQPKMGRWIEVFDVFCECSECGCVEAEYSNYCPNCGAKMEGKVK